MIRERQSTDEAEIKALYDGDIPALIYERVLVEDGKIVGHAGIRMVPEVTLALAKGHPAAKMHWLRRLHEDFARYVNVTGTKRVIALVAPKIERSFLRRLGSLGWVAGFQSAIFLVEGEDGIRNRSTERPVR